MKITDVKVHIMHGIRRNWVLAKVLTDEGVHGWGEGTLEYHEKAVEQAIYHLAERIEGCDPTQIELAWQVMYRHGFWRGGVVIGSALSAIDQALWDITGKVYGQPVYKLLGGAVRERVRAYSHAQDLRGAAELVDLGFSAFKIASWNTELTEFHEEDVPQYLHDKMGAMRRELGPDISIMIDNHGRSRPGLAIRQMQAVAEFKPAFFEEPTPPDNLDALAIVRDARVPIDLATGERLFFRWGYKELLARGLVDVIQPDICHAGGISELRRIASMAEMEYVRVAPHNPNGPVATAANVHLCATLPNFYILETARDMPWHDQVQLAPLKLIDGYFELPTEPGLGIDLDEDLIASRPYQQLDIIPGSWDADDGTPRDV
jgi:galactonate dehydratase